MIHVIYIVIYLVKKKMKKKNCFRSLVCNQDHKAESVMYVWHKVFDFDC